MGIDDNKAAVTRAIQLFDTGDYAGYMELYDPDVVLHGYSPEPLRGAAVRGFYDALTASFSDLRLTSHDLIAEGDKVVTRFTMRGYHTGPFMGIPPGDRPFSVEGVTILRFVRGKCVERWSSLDFLGLLTQIGAIPGPG